MKNIFKLISYFVFFAILAIGCDSEDEITEDWIASGSDGVEPTMPSNGDLDISKYMAIGDSYAAGFADNALYPEGQEYSYPAIVARQLKLAGGGDFTNPDIVSGNGNSGAGTGKTFVDLEIALAVIAGDPNFSLDDAIITTESSPITSSTLNSINNYGAPGARSLDLIFEGYGAANPFFGAFQVAGNSSVVGDAAAAQGSVYSLWIGGNDVLGYAISGGVNDSFDAANPSTITDNATFSSSISGALDALGSSEVLLVNVPPVTLLPYFQVVTLLGGGVNLITGIDAATAQALKAGYAEYNDGLDAALALGIIDQGEYQRRQITFNEGSNPPVITDESLTVADISAALGFPPGSVLLPNWRQAGVDATTGLVDLFPINALSVLGVTQTDGSVPGVSTALDDAFSLTVEEQVRIISASANFSGILAAEASARSNVTLVDAGPLFADLFGLSAAEAAGLALSADAQAAADGVLGITVNGVNLVPLSLSTTELYNSVFSTDFIHLNGRGAGLVANEIIKTINANYGASIPEVNVLDLPGINAPL